jgi:hypothetical protein
MDTSGLETHRTLVLEIFRKAGEICLAPFLRLALVSAGAGLALSAAVSALVFVGMGRNVFRIRSTRSRSLVDLAVIGWAFLSLFALLSGCHNISTSYPSIEATDMPFAEAMM